MSNQNDLADLEKRIIKEEEEIKKLESRIDNKEDKILDTQNRILISTGNLALFGKNINKYQAKLIHSAFVKRLNKHKILYSFITLVSVILIWSGIQTFLASIPFVKNPLVSIGAGVLIVFLIDRELT